MRAKLGFIVSALGLGLALGACAGDDIGSGEGDASSIPFAENSAEASAIKAVANDRSLDFDAFDDEVALHKKAAQNLIAYRDGDLDDAGDDNDFDTLAELYSVSYCKSTCLKKLLKYAKANGYYGGNENISVIFSPQSGDDTHLQRIADTIDAEADDTIDIAMYSYSHQEPVRGALQRALDRGVQIRFLADTDLANSASKGGGLEAMGINVRRVTKIMHHKFAIIDGPRDNETLDRASDAFIITGSANWSGSAATKYDENTLFMTGYTELALRLQRDFDYLYAGSKDAVHVEGLEWDQTRGDITDELIAENDDPNTDAFLTSYNFKPTASQGWSVLGTTVVTDQLVEIIAGAEKSMHIASGHFLNEPIAKAILDALENNPDLEVEIVLDCQEVSKSGNIASLKKAIEAAGGSIYYKCNTYRWHYKYADQMHHKYLVVDGKTLFTGSLNFSMNAEINTFENMLMFAGPEHAPLVASYLQNHAKVRGYGRDDNMQALTDLEEEIETGDSVPLNWKPAISMDLGDFQDLKDLIRAECPATKSWLQNGAAKTYNKYFNKQPQWFSYCKKDGYAWPSVPVNMRCSDTSCP
jgi:phosphatidylserine/phosphatidylglycerophosphate/cardiolipin synthase-like enzyme